MGIQTGVVMEVEPGEVTVLSSTGEFRKVKINGKMPELGAVISLPPTRAKKPWAASWMGWVAAAAAAVLIFAAPWALPGDDNSPQVIAYVTVDINPSIQLALDEEEEVISARPWNEDGNRILKKVKLKGLPAEKAVETITIEALKEGYIGKQKENTVIFTVAPGAKEVNPVLETNLKQSVHKVLEKENLEGKVQTLKATEQVLKVANENGVSPGKLVILAELEKNVKDVKVSVEDIKTMSISEAIKVAGANPEELIDKAHQDTKEGTFEFDGDKIRAINPPKTAEGVDKNYTPGSVDNKDNPVSQERPDKSQVITTDKTMQEPKPKEEPIAQDPNNTKNGSGGGESQPNPGNLTGGNNDEINVIPKPRVENSVYDPKLR